MAAKYEHFMVPGAFPDKETPDIDIADEAAVQCYVPVVNILFQKIVICKRSQINFDMNI